MRFGDIVLTPRVVPYVEIEAENISQTVGVEENGSRTGVTAGASNLEFRLRKFNCGSD